MNIIFAFFVANWETIIAILGFGISLINLFYLIKNNIKSIDINEMYYLKIFLNKKYLYEFSTMIINKSRQPISIINMEIINKEKSYYAKPDKTIISEKKDSQGIVAKIMTADFPINLTCLEAKKEIIYFKLDEELEKEKFDLIIYTNRGKIVKKVDYSKKQMRIEEYLKNLF